MFAEIGVSAHCMAFFYTMIVISKCTTYHVSLTFGVTGKPLFSDYSSETQRQLNEHMHSIKMFLYYSSHYYSTKMVVELLVVALTIEKILLMKRTKSHGWGSWSSYVLHV